MYFSSMVTTAHCKFQLVQVHDDHEDIVHTIIETETYSDEDDTGEMKWD